MTNFEKIKNMTLDEFAEWLDKYGNFDKAPWTEWFSRNYCENCPSEKVKVKWSDTNESEEEVGWCELEHKCKFFQDMDEVPDNLKTIKMWLEQKIGK